MVDWFELARNCKAPAEVRAAIDQLRHQFEKCDPGFGFAHIVLEDYDLSDASINACLGDKSHLLAVLNDRIEQIGDWDSTNFHSPTYDLAELLESVAATINLLKGFLFIPEAMREVEEFTE